MNRPIDAASGFGMPQVPPADGPTETREPQNPQDRLVHLADQMLMFRPESGKASAFLRLTNTPPLGVMNGVREHKDALFSRLLIKDGDKMPDVPKDETVRVVDSALLTRVRIEAHSIKEKGHPKRRIVELVFSYRYPGPRFDTVAMQRLSLEHDPNRQDALAFNRVASVNPDDDMSGYDKTRKVAATDKDAAAFLSILEGLFKTWKEENPERVKAVAGSQPQAPVSNS